MATPRQEKAAQLYIENGGKSASAAMRDAGYSEATAKNPNKLTSSPTWDDLMDKYLPDKKLVDVHKKMLNAFKLEHMVFPLGMEEQDIKKLLNSVGSKPKKIKHGESAIHVWYWAPDQTARAKSVELGYKVKGKLTQKIEHSGEIGGLFGDDTLTIRVVDGRDKPES
jgi:phage terminase small subunit